MASRRMLDKNFILSDNYTTLPLKAQLLYVHLILSADDEGFVNNATTLERMLGGKKRWLSCLQEAGYVHSFSSGVTLIMHWQVHNKVRKSTFRPTQFTAEKSLVELGSDKIYRLKNDAKMTQNCDRTASQDRIGKERIGKDRTDKKAAEAANASGGVCVDKDFEAFWNAYPKKTDRPAAKKQFEKTTVPLELLLNALEAQKQSHQWKAENGIYVPNPATWLKNRRWEDQLPAKSAIPPTGAAGGLGPEELAAIQRALTEGA